MNSSTEAKVQRIPISPPVGIERLSFGYSEAIADTLWLRSIQDFDYCSRQVKENVCEESSWLYRMLDAVTDLAPKFRVAYSAGALALTVMITDVEGASKLFNKGIQAFPNDWPILYRAAYHFLYEEDDKARAAELLIRAGENGAPPWVFSLAGRLYTDAGHLDLARSVLKEMRETKQEDAIIKRLEEKIASIEAEQAAKK